MAGPDSGRRRGDWVWAGGIVVLLVLMVWWIPGDRAPWRDSYSLEPSGKSGFFRLLAATGRPPRRSLAPLVEALRGLDTGATLCLLGPARYPGREEWAALHDWVCRGGRLVFAARADDPAVELEGYDVKVEPDSGLRALCRPARPKDGEAVGPDVRSRVETGLVKGKVQWDRSGAIHCDEDFAETLVAVDGSPQVIRFEVGAGGLVVAASDRIFSNRVLAGRKDDSALLAYRIVEAAGPGRPVWFEEYLNTVGSAKVAGILLDPEFRHLTLQLALILLLLLWWGFHRFGAAAAPREDRRRSIVEHAVALGNLHFKAGTGARLVGAYLDYFERETGLRASLRRPQDAGRDERIQRAAARLVRGTGADPERVSALLLAADRARRRTTLTAQETLRRIRPLAKLLGRQRRSGGAATGGRAARAVTKGTS
ncbi:MAG: DUF4350 domain-containing protein [Planctomycetes bacterium]|nr:DUF4350 domain-containing protein [Planctomycetota bacterium]